MAQRLKRLPLMQETWVQALGWEDPLEKEMATHSSIPAWRIPWMAEPGRLQSAGSQRVGHDWVTSLRTYCWSRQWHPTPVLLPGKSHGRRTPVGCSPLGSVELDTTEWLHFHFSLSCIGGGNGNPLQCSCLENPGDGGAWWAAVYGVTQSRTQLKWFSSSSKDLLYSIGDSSQYSVMTYMGRESTEEWVYVYA